MPGVNGTRRWTLLLAHVLVACGGQAADVFVDLRTDLDPRLEFASVETVIRSGEATVSSRARANERPDDFLIGVRVARFTALPTGESSVVVRLLEEGGAEVARGEATLSISGDAAVTVVVRRSCRDVVCPEPGGSVGLTACLAGRCVSPECAAGDRTRCPHTTLSPEELFASQAEAVCSTIEACFGAAAHDLRFDHDSCERYQARETGTTVAVVEDLIARGTLAYNGVAAAACIDAIRAGSCVPTLRTADYYEECGATFEGLVPIGGECTVDVECAGATYCHLEAACPGECRAFGTAGDGCRGTRECSPLLRCLGGVCRPPLLDGETCDRAAVNGGCAGGSLCLAAGVCVRPADAFTQLEGERCEPMRDALCARGLACDLGRTGVGVCVPVVGPGEPCSRTLPDVCPRGERCDLELGSCRPLPGEGEGCFEEARPQELPCAPGHACDGGVCVPEIPAGGECTEGAACSTRTCAGGRCDSGAGCR